MAIRRLIHPATEIILFVILAVILWKNIWFTVLVSMFVLSVLVIFNVTWKKLYRYTVGALWIVFLLIVVSAITTGNVLSAFLTGYRLLLLIVLLSLISLISSPFDITYGISALLKPLKYIGFPTSELAFVLAMSLRFIPLMSEEVERIITAQRARGFDIKNIRHVLSVGYSILVPVFISAVVKAEAMAISLYLRGVDVKKGIPPVKEIRFGIIDILILLIAIALLVVSVYA
ncbi:MAG: energy-coupling factor transporter transmembrane protein EcfT [Dictyoglomi bacterium]|nr:energy-coupling factor transporter transmembrane protein EcfT [Dictyoglomota bacterium]